MGNGPAASGRARHLVWLFAGLMGAGFVLRAPLSSVGPILPAIRDDLGMDPAVAGLTGTIPIVCFGLFAFLAPWLVPKLGPERTLGGALIALCVALVLRSAGDQGLFFAGTALVGAGIAVGNVIPPGVVRERFPTRIATLSSLNVVVMNIGSALGSAAAQPLADAGLGWRGSLAIWAAPAVAALVVWTLAAKAVLADDRGKERQLPRPTGLGRVARRSRPWLMAVFVGTQSAGIYCLFTWLATILRARGTDATTAGLLVGLISVLGIVGALAVGPVLQRGHLRLAVYTLLPTYAIGLALIAFGQAAVLGTILCGVTQGACFAVVLTMIGQEADPADVPATSALVQGMGYLLASVAPFVVGALFQALGDWTLPSLFISGLLVVSSVVGVILVRPGRR